MVTLLREDAQAVLAATRIRLLCLDLDGTLLDDEKNISDANRAAIARARRAGIAVAIASGRHPFSVEQVTEDLGIPACAVCLSGAYAVLGDVCVHACPLDGAVLESLIGCAERQGAYIAISGAGFNLTCGFIDRGPGEPPAFVRRYEQVPTYADLRVRFRSCEGAALKVALHTETDEEYLQLRAALDELDGIETARSDIRWVDVTAAGCSKAVGIAAITQALGLGKDAVAVMGDDENDVAALRTAGIGIVPANACPDARAAADVMVASNVEDGVAEAIAWLLGACDDA